MPTISDQQIDSAYQRAPQPIKDLIDSDDAIPTVVLGIASQYKLHIDITGVLAGLTRNMILGLINPSQFLGNLLAAGITEPDARRIMGEINEKIFKPLQAQMRAHPAPPRPVEPPLPPPQPIQPPPRPMPPPPPPPQMPPAMPPAPPMPPRAAPLPPRTVLPGAPPRQIINPMPRPGGAAVGSEQSRGIAPPPSGEAPTNLPTGEEEPQFNELPPLAKPTSPLSSEPPPGAPPHTRYPSDPYREPPDEK